MVRVPLLALLAACADRGAADGDRTPDPAATTPPPTSSPTTPTGETAAPPGDPDAPFAPMPDRGAGLVDVSADLAAVLEQGALVGACDRWRQDPEDRQEKLLCGKSMFFDEGFGTMGIPAVVLDGLPRWFEDEVGPSTTGLGLVADPRHPGRPLGFGPGRPEEGVETLAMTCAACHFGQLPDGRYAVGAPNHRYRYGVHMLTILLAPQAASPTFRERDHDPRAIEKVRPVLDALDRDPLLRARMGLDLLSLVPLLDAGALLLGPEQEGQYAGWAPGQMDFLIAPLPIDDGVHTVSKFSALWGLPDDAELAASAMPHALLGWTGGAESVGDFLLGFVAIGGGGPEWDAEALSPLRDYLLSLAPPEPPAVDPALAEPGAAVFAEAGCLACHAEPRGAGDRVYTFEEIGTDDALEAWGDPEGTGVLCCGLGTDAPATHGVKSPRLVGLWAMDRFLHNGELGSLEELLCLAPRPRGRGPAYGTGGHRYGCELPTADREALAAWLRSH